MINRAIHSVTSAFTQRLLSIAGVSILTTSLWVSGALAGDPFRTGNQARPIGPETEAAFKSLFEQGNYSQAQPYLQAALESEPSEPLSYVMQALLAYRQNDQAAFKRYAMQTRNAGERLGKADPLRSHIYIGVGNFLEVGAAISGSSASPLSGSSLTSSQVQQGFKALDAAAAIAPNDPELNLVKGFVDLLLAANFPFSSPDSAIERLEDYAEPDYIVHRGLAIYYRDQDQPAKALGAVEQALQSAPGNPELLYSKGQILAAQGKQRESLALFEQALAKRSQLPASLVKQITQARDQVLRAS